MLKKKPSIVPGNLYLPTLDGNDGGINWQEVKVLTEKVNKLGFDPGLILPLKQRLLSTDATISLNSCTVGLVQ